MTKQELKTLQKASEIMIKWSEEVENERKNQCREA